MFQITIVGILLILASSASAEPYAKQLTIFADAGRVECFHQPVAATEQLIVDYQVIHGGHGETNINFMLMDPKRVLLVTEQKQGKGKHNMTAMETGSYKLCFDNTISSFNRKIVTFHLQVQAANQELVERHQLRNEMHTEYHFERAYTDLHHYLSQISVNLMRSRQAQDFIRAHEARDRNVAESNFAMVNNWSWMGFAMMIAVGLLQVIMVRGIFYTDGRLYKFWKRF